MLLVLLILLPLIGAIACAYSPKALAKTVAMAFSLATLAVGWVLANPAVTSPIIGASKPEQLADSLAAAKTRLPGELKTRLDELTLEWRAVDAER